LKFENLFFNTQVMFWRHRLNQGTLIEGEGSVRLASLYN
jgi:hypothetical protein